MEAVSFRSPLKLGHESWGAKAELRLRRRGWWAGVNRHGETLEPWFPLVGAAGQYIEEVVREELGSRDRWGVGGQEAVEQKEG